MIKAESENPVNCETCGQISYMREVVVFHNGMSRKIAYTTHHESVIDDEHKGALIRLDNFYKRVLDIIAQFDLLPDETKIVKVDDPPAGGTIIELDFTSIRPSACNIRTTVVPEFIFKTFNTVHIINLSARSIDDTNLDQLLLEVKPMIENTIRHSRDNFLLGL